VNDGPFEVVFVCTGNRFRSPLAAAFMLEAVPHVPLDVRSLGTLELGATGALAEALEVAGGYGIDLSRHRSRCLSGVELAQADLVVGFERKHVAAAVVEAAAPAERTFMFPELVALLERMPAPRNEEDPVRRARAAVARAQGLRDAQSRAPGSREVRDPLGLPDRAQREIAAQVYELTRRLAVGLFGPAEVRSSPAVPETGSRRGWFRGR
jgi:protein-tyrosine phosphatase